jgi:hypothetical protein
MRSWQDLKFWLVRNRGLFITGFDLLTLKLDLLIENFNIGYIFWLISTKALTFHMSVSCDKTFLLVPTNMTFWPWCLNLLKTLTLAITFEWYILGLWYFTWVFLVIKPYHGYKRFDLVTLTLVFKPLIDNFNLGYNFWMVHVYTRALIFHMSIPCDKTLPWLQKVWPCDFDLGV